ncbi:MAG: DNA alkylation repair protein [Candidatus Omnitrophica bacterium]|nr:DNA alkylation repair protein [Candidatus Omnitrophota bacterium]MCB9748338.1 DNA alkylation repair protein [Candidatus Omnitrophota bacterium]
MNKYAKLIQKELIKISDPAKARWLENYVKHDIVSRGCGIPLIRNVIQDHVKEYNTNQFKMSDQCQILNDLMAQKYTEDKLASIIYMQLYWKEEAAAKQLELISEWFDNRWIADWNVCDWLCVRVLTPMLDCKEDVVKELTKWNANKYLWKARASLVPFAQAKMIEQYKDVILKLSKVLIKREERFAKTSVGWVLREYSKYDKKFVTAFLKEHQKWTTPEVIKNSTKYFHDTI